MPRSSRPPSNRRPWIAVVAVALGPVVSAIGLGAASGSARATTHTVTMEAVSFRPDVLTIRVGDSIVWVNRDPFPHTATSSRFDSKVIEAGRSWTHTARAPGELAYVCALHPTMKATLRVR